MPGKFARRSLIVVASMSAIATAWWWYVRRARPSAPPAASLILDPMTMFRTHRPQPTRLVVQWQTSLSASVYLSQYAFSFPYEPYAVIDDQTEVVIDGLEPNRRYFVKFVLADGTEYITAERMIPLQRVPNLRDIGGYRTQDGHQVKWGQVYRASALDRLNEQDHETLRELNVHLVCDMRTLDETTAAPDQLPRTIDYLHLPVTTTSSRWMAVLHLIFDVNYLSNLLLDLYTRVVLDENPQVFEAIFGNLAQADRIPMIVHCAAGKDRTGVLTAVLLSFLGVDDETIIADYTLSNTFFDFFHEAGRTVMQQLTVFGISDDEFNHLLLADGAVMRETLAHLYDVYGSAEQYLRQHVGLDEQTLAAVRTNLLE